jgi:hypothetical protein
MLSTHTHDLDRAHATVALLCHGFEEAWDDSEGLAGNVKKLRAAAE